MSQKASPWQNGYKESFYSGFKLELGHPECYLTLGELIEAIAQQIHYYNNLRIHTALKCPPAVFAQRVLRTKQPKQLFSENWSKNNAPEYPRTVLSEPRRCLIPLFQRSNRSPLLLTNQLSADTQSV